MGSRSDEQRIDELSEALLDAIAEEPMPGFFRRRCRSAVRKYLSGPLLSYVKGSQQRPLHEVLEVLVLVYDPTQRQVRVEMKC